MAKNIIKISLLSLLCLSELAPAQLFRTKDRMDRLEGFDDQKFSWGFFLAGNFYDYKIVLNPIYGIADNKNLITSKGTSSFGAGLMGKMRLNENFDLRLEPGLQFVQREMTFNTESNIQYGTGTPTNSPFNTHLQQELKTNTVKTTYIDVPLLLEYHGDRWYNSRPYVAAGINYMVNLQSNEGNADDNAQNVFRTTTHNFGWSAEAGIQLYFSRFKLTPAIRGTFVTNNEIVADNPSTPPYWAAGISSAQTRAIMLVLKFE